MTDIKSKLKDIMNTVLVTETNGNIYMNTQANNKMVTASANATFDANFSNGNLSNSPYKSNKGRGLNFSLDSYRRPESNDNRSSYALYNRSRNSEKRTDNSYLTNLHARGVSKSESGYKKRIDDLFDKDKSSVNEFDFSLKKKDNRKKSLDEAFSNLLDKRSNSVMNRSRDHSVNINLNSISLSRNNTSSFINCNTSSCNYTTKNSNNSRLKREIALLSKTLTEGRESNQRSFINRPPVSLNRPDLELNSRDYLEFSPIRTRQNVMVTSNALRNYSINNNDNNNYSSHFNKLNGGVIIATSKNNNSLPGNTLFNKNQKDDYGKLNFFTKTNTNNNDKFKYDLNERKSFIPTQINTITYVENTANDSIEDFIRVLDSNHKDTYMTKYKKRGASLSLPK